MVPLWQRRKGEVTDEEYDKFYQEKFFDYVAPQRTIPISVEGTVTYKALLFIPGKTLMISTPRTIRKGCSSIPAVCLLWRTAPTCCRITCDLSKGVVDTPDVSLNISREMLQHDRQLKVIAANLKKKILAELAKMLREDRTGYEAFFKNFGLDLKYGVIQITERIRTSCRICCCSIPPLRRR